jgi:hypothetical protein
VSDSVWNRLGDIATNAGKNLAKFGLEVVGATVVAPTRFAWDVFQAPWNDDKEYNGFINTFKSAGGRFHQVKHLLVLSAVHTTQSLISMTQENAKQLLKKVLGVKDYQAV